MQLDSNEKILQDNNEIKALIQSLFPKFELDLSLCNPASTGLTKTLYVSIFTKLNEFLPEHIKGCVKFRIKLQASLNESIVLDGQAETETVKYTHCLEVFGPYSEKHSKALVGYAVEVVGGQFEMAQQDIRAPAEIRKSSLFGHDRPIILIVDDDFVAQRLVGKIISDLNSEIKVIHAKDGEEGIALYKQYYHCALIFMDYQMPKKNGVEAIQAINKFQELYGVPKVPIIGLTASDSSEFGELTDELVQKPYNRYKINGMVQKFVPHAVMLCLSEDTELNEKTHVKYGSSSSRMYYKPVEARGCDPIEQLAEDPRIKNSGLN